MSIFPSSMPYDDLKIIDQSGYVEETPIESPYIPDGPIAFIPFISPRGYGEDNELKYMSSNHLAKYGDPNLKKYGLSLYLAKRFIEGGGSLLGMRVTTDNYRYANLAVVANITKNSTQAKFITRTNTINNKTTFHPVFKEYKINTIDSETNKVATKTASGYEYTFEEIIYVDENSESAQPIPGNTDSLTRYANIKDNSLFVKYNSTTKNVYELSVNGVSHTFAYNYGQNEPGIFTEVVESEGSYIPLVNGLLYEYILSTTAMIVKYDIVNIIDAVDESYASDDVGIKGKLSSNTYYDVPSEGAIKIPLFYVRAKGAGSYGNAFKARITLDNTMNSYINTTDGDAFCYKFIDSDNGKNLDNNISFTFNDDYLYNNEPMSISEVFEKYTENIKVGLINSTNSNYSNTIEEFYSIINDTIVASTSEVNPDKWNDSVYKIDVLFGSNIDTNIYFVDTSWSSVNPTGGKNLSRSIGWNFAGGVEDADTATFSFANDIYADALAAAYNGEAGKDGDLIYDEVRYPYQFLFAPSVNDKVVEAIKNLASVNRHCTRASFFVKGSNSDVPPTYSEARAQVKTMGLNSWRFDCTSEWARITDPYTARKVFMPSVYFTAYTYPRHWNNHKGKPLAGRQNAVWNGFDVGTVTPRSANKDEYIQNHNVGLNTMCEDGLGYASLYEQITSQSNSSRLSEINNSQVLCEMIKIALKLANDNRWSDLGENEISQYKTQVENAISSALSNCYEKMEVIAIRESTNGAGRNRILCKINVLFKDMLKGVSYEFYILAS